MDGIHRDIARAGGVRTVPAVNEQPDGGDWAEAG